MYVRACVRACARMYVCVCARTPDVCMYVCIRPSVFENEQSITEFSDHRQARVNKFCHLSAITVLCLFVLRFLGPVNPLGSCQARSVYLTTRLLGRLSHLSG